MLFPSIQCIIPMLLAVLAGFLFCNLYLLLRTVRVFISFQLGSHQRARNLR
jgi:hypothetical protein